MARLPLAAELLKLKGVRLVWATFVAFALAPVLGAIFVLILRDGPLASSSSALATKARVLDFRPDWPAYVSLLTQAVGVGGVLVFGFVASYLFGREYSDGTAKDLLALPTSRARILNAKFVVYAGWCLGLALSNLVVGLLLGGALGLGAAGAALTEAGLGDYFVTTLLTMLAGLPVAFFALYGRGYLAPLGFVALTLVFAQVIASTGYGAHFPWSVPGLYSGAGGAFREGLGTGSYAAVVLTAIAGYLACLVYWRRWG